MKILKKLYLALMLIFLYAPIIVLMVFSFNEAKSRAIFSGFSLRWYARLFNDSNIMEAVYNTLAIAFLSALFATILGTAAALGINAMKKTPRKIVMALTNITVMNPDIVAGVSLMLIFLFIIRLVGMGQMGFVTLLLSHITFNIPYVIISVLPKIRQLDKSMYEAAQDLGATPGYAFRHIVIPQLMPGIMTGAIFAFTLSLDDFVISFFTKGAGSSNLSVLIYSLAAKKGISPEINALSTIMFIVVITLLFIINRRNNADTKNKSERTEAP